jgi:hypothetical protein
MKVNIHNQCSDFKLKYLIRYWRRLNWNKNLDVEVDTCSMTSAYLTSLLATFEGSLTYQLQRKCDKYDDQLESVSAMLFVAWKSEGYKAPRVHVCLIEYDKRIKWNGYKLGEYYQRYANQLSTYTGPIKDTWLTRNGTILMTRLELDFTQRDGVLNIIISEGVWDGRTKIPEWISPER